MYYLNFYFKELEHTGDTVTGLFDAPDYDIHCHFRWVIGAEDCKVWDNNKPMEEISPLPLWWLEKKLCENGKLKAMECKISY